MNISPKYMKIPLEIELDPPQFGKFLKFIEEYYVVPKSSLIFRYTVEQTIEGYVVRFLEVCPAYPQFHAQISIFVTTKPYAEIYYPPTCPSQWLTSIIFHLKRTGQTFARTEGNAVLSLLFITGKPPITEKLKTPRSLGLFSDSMIMLYIFAYLIILVVFFINPVLAILLAVVAQLAILFNADKIVYAMGKWKITDEYNIVQLVKIVTRYKDLQWFLHMYGSSITEIKQAIYERTIALGELITPLKVLETLRDIGIDIEIRQLDVKNIDLYRLVSILADKFKVQRPKIAIANVLLPNAAAAGISPKRSTLLITSGLLGICDEGELEVIVGHEFSHIKGRDPLCLFSLFMGEYALRILLFYKFPFLVHFWLLYFFAAFTLLFFFAKFFEAKSDLEAIYVSGKPKELASALRKFTIFMPAYKLRRSVLRWFSWDPHPPLWFRIERSEEYAAKGLELVKHFLLRSVIDVIKGLFRDLFKLKPKKYIQGE